MKRFYLTKCTKYAIIILTITAKEVILPCLI
nr:MAG TPA: hypothetical protein [Caudoviricetes sp.]